MTRLVVALLLLSGLAACSYERQSRAVAAPTGYERTTVVTTAPGTLPPSTKDTFQGVGRPAG
jgi:hypothetical protein